MLCIYVYVYVYIYIYISYGDLHILAAGPARGRVERRGVQPKNDKTHIA